MAKTKSDGNGQPGKANTRKAALAELTKRITAYGKSVITVRDAGQRLLYDAWFFALGVGDGNLQPLARTVQVSKGMAQRDMVKWCEKFLGVKGFKDKDTKAEGFKATDAFKLHQAEYKANKIKYGSKLQAEKKYWELDEKSPFEGLDLMKLVIAAANKTEKYSADPDRKDKVKHADLVPSLRKWIAEHTNEDDDDGGEPEGDDTSIMAPPVGDEGEAIVLN